MKKIIMTAALAIAVTGAAQAQGNSAGNIQNVTVPNILLITTNPTPASADQTFTDGMLGQENLLTLVTYKVRANSGWSMNSVWSFGIDPTPGLSDGDQQTASLIAFRNAYKVSFDGAPYVGFESNGGNADPVPTYGLQPATDYDGRNITMQAKVLPLGYTVVPGTYKADLTLTLSNP